MTSKMKHALAAVAVASALMLSGCASEPVAPESLINYPEPTATVTVTEKPALLTTSSRQLAKSALDVALDDAELDLADAEVLLDRAYRASKKAIRKHKAAQR